MAGAVDDPSHDGVDPQRTVDANGQGGVRNVKSAARAVEVLEMLAARQNRPARLKELSEALHMPRSSLYALMRTLVARGWVRTDASGTLYNIGIRALLVGTSYLDSDPFVRIVRPHVDVLGADLDETVHHGRLDGPDVVYLATHESSQYLRPFSRVGRRLPAYSNALGKAVLAELSEEALADSLPDRLEALTELTLTDRPALLADLQRARERGYALDHEENTLGLGCVAFALRYSDPVQDAISCSVPVARLSPSRLSEITDALRETRDRIEALLPPAASVRTPWL